GTIFRVEVAAVGTATYPTTSVLEFTGAAGAYKGSAPRGNLVMDGDGMLWGVTYTGGTGGRGTIFKVDPTKAATPEQAFTTVVDFGAAGTANLELRAPANGLTYDGDGHMWGICSSGTGSENWAFYRVAVADGTVTKVAEYTATGPTPDGKAPKAAPVGKVGSDWLYGTTSSGGQFGHGTLYRLNAVTGEHETLVHFSGQSGLTAGSDPSARLHIHTDGTVWGTTRVGGASQLGSVFKYNPATRRFTHVGSFSGSSGANIGSWPISRMTTGPDGYIWGTVSLNAPTGGDGSLFKIDPNGGGIVIVKTFQGDWLNNPPGGKRPESGLVVDQQGYIWGATTRGGGISATPSTTVGYGTIFRVDPMTHEVTTVFKFTGDAGALPGMEPKGELVMDADGNIWGQTSTRVFKFNPATQTMLSNETFVNATGYPLDLAVGGGLYLHQDGELYGYNSSAARDANGTTAGGGIIYRVRPGLPTLTAGNLGSENYPKPIILTGGYDLDGSGGTLTFEWGPTTALGRSINAAAVSGGATANIGAVRSYTNYFFRLRADTANGPVFSPIQSFLTRNINENLGVVVQAPIGMPLVSGSSTVSLGAVRLGESGTETFTIQNITASGVTVSSVAVGGTDADLFTASAVSATSLAARQEFVLANSGFTVTYTPDEAAAHSATLTITTTAGTFTVNLSGSGVVEPDIAVTAGGFGLSTDSDESVDYGLGTLNVGIIKSFAIQNTGNGALTGISAEIIGANAADFVLQGSVPGSLAAGAESAFNVVFTPTVGGERSAILRITSDDPAEGSIDIALRGQTPGAANLVVELDGQPVIHNPLTPISFGTLSLGLTATKTFTIRNTGTAPLTPLSVAYLGGNQSTLPATGLPVGTLYPGESAPLVIIFRPQVTIFQQASYTISSNAANNNAFIIKVSGTGDNSTIPEIDIENADGDPFADGGTINFGTPAAGITVNRTYTIRNTGAVNLTLSAAFAAGSAGDFKLLKAPGATVAPNGSTTFTVTFKPSSNGTINGELRITNNDTNENPYNVFLVGTGVNIPVPDLEVELDGSPIDTGAPPINYGVVPLGSTPAVKTFKISNVGTGPLSGIKASFAAGSSPDFKLTKAVGTSLTAGASANMDVTFKPTKNNSVTAKLVLVSSDPDESPFEISFTGAGLGFPEPEIAVERQGANINSGGTFNFAATAANATRDEIFTIKNTGQASLTGISVAFENGSSPAFSLVTPPTPTATVAKGASTTFAVRFAPGAAITANTVLRITSNDANEGTFAINLSGIGTATLAPMFTQHPVSRLILLNGAANFGATVTGVDNSYQWKKNGANIKNATGATLSFTAKTADVGAYTLFASNSAGSNTSRPGYLGLVTLSQGTLLLKEEASFTLNCTVTIPNVPGVSVSYSWRRSGNPLTDETDHISGAQTKTLKVSNLTLADSGNYTCLVTMKAPDGSSTCANGDTVVNVVQKPTITAFTLPDILVSETVSVPPVTADFAAKFKATGLPPGVTLNADTGEFAGKPTAAKIVNNNVVPYAVSFTATNPAGTSAPVVVNWLVQPLDSSLIGAFNGLVARDSYTNLGFGGTLQITTTNKGSVTGSVVLAGQKYPVTGVLDASSGDNPSAVLTAKRNDTLGNLTITVTSIEEGEDRLSGFIQDENFDLIESQLAVGTGSPGSANGSLDHAELNGPRGIVLDEDGGFIADTGNHVIRRVLEDEVTTFAGQNGTPGTNNGNGTSAQFSSPEGLALDASGNLYVADTGNHAVRKITPTGEVTTITAPANIFSSPCALAFDDKGNLVVVNRGNHTLVKIATNGTVTILAGKAGITGHKDGSGTVALFDSPGGICFDAKLKAFFVTDTGNRVIRKVTATGSVSTYAGAPDVEGVNPGVLANARLVAPTGIASDGQGMLVVADSVLVVITPGGFVFTATDFVDDVNEADQPMALAFNPEEDGVLAADAGLHGITQHEGVGPLPGAAFVARRNIWTTAAPVPLANQGKYTAGLTNSQVDDAFPQGHGYVTLLVGKTGTAAIAGKTADGNGITFSTTVGPDGEIMLHQMLHKNTGSLQGMTFVDGSLDWFSANGVDTPFDWYKVPQALSVADRAYKAGFPVHDIVLSGGKYTPENNVFAFLGLEP
ncbi:MAG TPA: choice-of-anchor D domain-containing protein, partial [Prosthecobacter sp.]|nr:choice-of-anchor D domain-containing protein [Prosthecobacter sp.]